jgi:Zn-dependent protease/CBS domain-containing protein
LIDAKAMRLEPVYLGRLWGIPVRAHYSWLPVFPFYSWAIGAAYLPREVPGLPSWQYWLLGVLTTGLLFISVLAHEFAHSLMARAEGIKPGGITLYLFGGLTWLEGEPARPSSEFRVAMIGPAASFLLGVFFLAANQALFYGTTHLAAARVLRHLGVVNLLLAGFNILPGLPLDGGRALRAALWHLRKDYDQATRTAMRAGLTISLALLIGGFSLFLYREWVTGLWSITIGMLLALMLNSSEANALMRRRARAELASVRDVMSREVLLVAPDMSIEDFIKEVLSRSPNRCFPVARDGRLYGMLVLEDLKSIPRERWPEFSVRDAMRPVDESMFVTALTPIAEARAKIERGNFGGAVVIDSDGIIVGHVSLKDVGRRAAV